MSSKPARSRQARQRKEVRGVEYETVKQSGRYRLPLQSALNYAAKEQVLMFLVKRIPFNPTYSPPQRASDLVGTITNWRYLSSIWSKNQRNRRGQTCGACRGNIRTSPSLTAFLERRWGTPSSDSPTIRPEFRSMPPSFRCSVAVQLPVFVPALRAPV